MMVFWIVLLFIVVFPMIWGSVCVLISLMGWSRLAAVYRTDTEATGDTFHAVTGRVGMSSYSNVLTVSIEPEGLRLAVMVLFRIGHPPVRIPWGDIVNVRKSAALWTRSYAFETERAGHVTIRLPERIVQGIIDTAS